MAKMRTAPKLVLLALGVALAGFGLKTAADRGIIPSPFKKSVVPDRVALPDAPSESSGLSTVSSTPLALPNSTPASVSSPRINMLIWAWNAQMGLLFANGASETTSGSLMEKHGVNLRLTRQDDAEKMKADLVTFANALSKGDDNPSVGAHYVAIMGDGAAQFLAGLNPTLKKLGDDYHAEVIGSAGYSRGEDKFMGLPQWKDNPQTARGGVVSGYLRDGDWNIAVFWAGQNGIPNNPDEKTYDPDALNWVPANDYIDAAQKYVANYCEDRPVVKAGRKTGETKHICVEGVVTWTPGDVTVAKKRGGLASILSTKENRSQMPNTIIGIHKWNQAHKQLVAHFLAATFEGGDQVKHYPQAFHKAAEISAVVYNEETAEYWAKYARGVVETDATGLSVPLGGSTQNNLSDNQQLFGLAPGSTNLFRATYETFGNIVKQQYPELVPNYPPTKDILDTSYIVVAASLVSSAGEADVPKFTQATHISQQVAKKNWTINFRSGSADFDPTATSVLNQLKDIVAVAGNLAVQLNGHTDSDGNPATNKDLSERRAFAVRDWLIQQSPTNFPEDRFIVKGYGDTVPLSPNNSSENKARNRRVQVVLGTTEE